MTHLFLSTLPAVVQRASVLALGAALFGGCVVDDGRGGRYDSADPYQSCVESFDCAFANDRCITIAVEADGRPTSARMCTRECDADRDCPLSGFCSDVSGTPLCYAGCIDDFDCDYAFTCGDTPQDGALCLPSP